MADTPRPVVFWNEKGINEFNGTTVRIYAVSSCATCQHYAVEDNAGYCADTRKHPMQHKPCPPTWGCPLWEAHE